MPCHQAMQKNVLTVAPSDALEEVLGRMQKAKQNLAVVLDDDDVVQGYISDTILLKNLLPVSIVMQDGIQLDVSVSATSGIAKRYKHIQALPVSDFMETRVEKLLPNSAIGEGVNALVKNGAPLFVVEENTDKLLGVIDESSILQELQQMTADKE